MLEITRSTPSELHLSGHFDASQVGVASPFFDGLAGSSVIHFDNLTYISSAGLSILLFTQQRLAENGGALTLAGLNPHIRMVFEYAGFDQIFRID
jgi:anti-anti-sigma factor